jgi:hypothetical protein
MRTRVTPTLLLIGCVSMAPKSVVQAQLHHTSAFAGVVDAGVPALPVSDFTPAVTDALFRARLELVREAEAAYRGARLVDSLPGWSRAMRDVARATRMAWRGLPPAIMVVPDAGRGFDCDGPRRDGCLGRYLGVTMMVQQGADSGTTTLVSVILIAESARTRPEVWMHELTHAMLNQHGRMEESRRHDRRYFAEEQFVRVEF